MARTMMLWIHSGKHIFFLKTTTWGIPRSPSRFKFCGTSDYIVSHFDLLPVADNYPCVLRSEGVLRTCPLTVV